MAGHATQRDHSAVYLTLASDSPGLPDTIRRCAVRIDPVRNDLESKFPNNCERHRSDRRTEVLGCGAARDVLVDHRLYQRHFDRGRRVLPNKRIP